MKTNRGQYRCNCQTAIFANKSKKLISKGEMKDKFTYQIVLADGLHRRFDNTGCWDLTS